MEVCFGIAQSPTSSNQKLDLEEHTPYPSILRSKDGSCVVMIHVDDLLVVGKRDYVIMCWASSFRNSRCV